MHGFSTVYLLFGPDDAERLMGFDNADGINGKCTYFGVHFFLFWTKC